MSVAPTLLEVLRSAAEQAPDRAIIHIRRDGSELRGSHADLLASAERVAGGLRETGLPPRSPLMITLDRSDSFQAAFWGALIAGFIPIPLAAEPERMRAVWASLDRPALLVEPATADRLPSWLDAPAAAIRTISVDRLLQSEPAAAWFAAKATDVAYLQFSSGSTGAPKGVALTHGNVTANLAQILAAAPTNPNDVLVTWLPYFHDMGLVVTHLAPLAGQFTQIKMAPLHFAKRPLAWLQVASRHRATILSTANFALGLTLRLVKPEQLAGIDLSSVRFITVGSEPISPDFCRRFAVLLAPCGLRPTALTPAYGLAEATVGVTLAPVDEPLRTRHLDRVMMAAQGLATPVDPGPDALELVDLGFPLPGCAVRIVDEQDRPVADAGVGNVQVRGPNVAAGYYGVADNGPFFCGDWLRTGDRGFLLDDRLTVTGRAKDIIFVNGRKFHAVDLENVIGSVPGVRPGKVAVVGRQDRNASGELISVFVAVDAADPDAATPTLHAVALAAQDVIGAPIDELIMLPAGAFPYTTSGKLERFRLRERLEAGEFADRVQAVRDRLTALRREPTSAIEGPRDESETAILRIWSAVLGRDPASFGVNDRFLALGGTSLQAMEVLTHLEALHGSPIEPATLLDRPTVADLAAWLRDHRPEQAPRPAGSRPGVGQGDDVAVIGMACRFPGAATPEEFWELLATGSDRVRDVPAERWDAAAIYDPAGERPNSSMSSWGSFLEDVAGFDASFFGIDPEEAAATDPQARLLLELAAETLERAGYPRARRSQERIGVFIGAGEATYQEIVLRRLAAGEPLHPATAVGNLRSLLAGRIASAFDLTGPAMAVDTACSSALVALHLARLSLLSGECDLALVGAVNLNLTSTPYQLLSRARALSPTGKCRAFDDDADGIVPGEGAGMVLLSGRARAEREGDPLHALIKGSAVNNDGRAISLMAPNPLRQQEVIAEAYRAAGIDPGTISYIEAHGTGTPIGDPIEIRSLAHVFPAPENGASRLLGSVKTNLGHLLNAAGMPGLLKAILALQHRQIPPTLHYQHPNRRFDLASAGFEVNRDLRDWEAESPRRAGVNAFGFGGANAHVILEEAPPSIASPGTAIDRRPALLLLSARSDAALERTVADLASHLAAHPELDADPGAVCFSAGTAHDSFDHRLATVVEENPSTALRLLAAGAPTAPVWRGRVSRSRRPRIAFLFSGQGSQYPGQGKRLAEHDPVFRQTFADASEHAGRIRGRTLLEWCWSDEVDRRDLAQTDIAQPLLVAFEIALGHMLRHWGVEPDAVAGHSVGEIAAACVSGAISVTDAVGTAVTRGRLMAELGEAGSMAAVFAPQEIVHAELARWPSTGEVVISAVNDPAQVVVSGRRAAVERLCRALDDQGYRAAPLSVSHAFHSPLMKPMLASFGSYLLSLPLPAAPRTPFLSTVSTSWIDGVEAALDADYWLDHVTKPVRFSAAVQRLAAEGIDAFVEIGPGSTLVGMVRNTLRNEGDDIAVEAVLQRGEDDLRAAFGAVGRLWTRGVPVDRRALAGDRAPARVILPTYPFERERCWLSDPREEAIPPAKPAPRRDAIDQLIFRPVWVEAPLRPAQAGQSGRWLIVAADLAPGIAAQFDAAGLNSAIVHDEEVATALADRQATAGIVIAAACGRPEPRGTVEAIDVQQRTQIERLLRIAQRIGERPADRRPGRLLVIGSDAYRTSGEDRVLAPERAAALGFAAALADELPGVESLAIDLAWRDGPGDAAARIAAEALAPASSGLVAWRGGRRLTRVLRNAVAMAVRPAPIRSDGIYLVTGGAAGIGAEIARSLARMGRPELVLVGRTALEEAPLRGALLSELEHAGARVSYERVDVADPVEVELLIERIACRGAIAGVVHAAGVAAPNPLAAKTMEDIGRVLAPKTRGIMAIDRALEHFRQQPDFVVAFSSFSAALPGLGGLLSDYVAANAFLDAYAVARHAAGAPFLTIDWAAWAETGMSVDPGLQGLLRSRGFRPLSSAVGVRAFERLVSAGAGGQVAVIDVDPAFTGLIAGFEGAREAPAAATAPIEKARETPAASFSAPGGIEQRLREMVAAALDVQPDQVESERSFMALGLQSLVAVDLVKQLERQGGAPLPTTLFFEYPTIRALAQYLTERAPALAGGPLAATAPTVANGFAPDSAADGPIPLTPVQRAFYVTSRLFPETPTLSLLRETIAGKVETDLLIRAFETLIARHQMLRMRIVDRHPDAGGPAQQVVDALELITARERWFEERDGEGDIAALETEIANTIFDIDHGPLFRVVLQREGPNRAHLVLLAHHLACDAWSLAILSDELWTAYAAFAAGVEPAAPERAASFAGYVSAERAASSGPEAEADRSWWHERLPSLLEIADRPLPFDGDPDAPPSAPVVARLQQLTREQAASLKRVASEHDVSLASLLLALYARTLARWSDRRDLVIAVAHAGRHHRLPGIERLVGTCADAAPIALQIDLDEPLGAFAARGQTAWFATQRHDRLTSVDLARLAGRGRGSGPRSISNASFSFAHFPGRRTADGALEIEEIAGRTGSASMRLVLLGWEANGQIGLSWNYPEALMRADTVDRLARLFEEEVNEAIASGRHSPEPSPDLNGESEAPSPAATALAPKVIRDACRRYAEKIAIEFNGDGMTYAGVLDRADRLSGRLLANGARRNQPVALLTYRGFEAVIGIVAAMGAGAPWLPLDAGAPIARQLQQLDVAGVDLLVHERRTAGVAEQIRAASERPLTLISATDLPDDAPEPFSPAAVEPDDIAYVIFTSGSTGTPKGVPITHKSFGLYLGWLTELYPITRADRAADNSAVFFDASAYQILPPLAVGATICMVPEELMRDPDGLVDFIERERISVWRGVSSVWERILTAIERRIAKGEPAPALANLRLFTLGGEAMFAGTVRRWMDIYGDRHVIINDYGPAEATITMTYYAVPGRPPEHATRIPIGRPIGTVTVAVLDRERRPVAHGEVGELYIGGPTLSPGYLNDRELTDRFFVQIDGERMYSTRDLVIQREDGVLEFVGRNDDQVKIGGVRIELGDIDAALAGFPGVERAAAISAGDVPGAEHLVAYLSVNGSAPSASDVRTWLGARIPSYMIPRQFILLDRLPLTPAGKIDRRALRERPLDTAALLIDAASEPARTETERIVAAVWKTVLDVPNAGREDDFFALGGDSIRMLDVLVRLEGLVPFVPRAVAFYRDPTLAAFSAVIDAGPEQTGLDVATPAAARGDRFAVTPTQAGFLFTEALHPGVAQNWCASIILEGSLDVEAFCRAADETVARHPMLRTIFPSGLRPPQQLELAPGLRLDIPFEDLSELDGDAQQRAALNAREHIERRTPFAVDRWPLLRMRLHRLSSDRHAWLITAHHLIGDGMSAWILGQDLLRAYDRIVEGLEPALPPLRSTFRDYVDLTGREAMLPRSEAMVHWRKVFDDPYAAPTTWRAAGSATAERTLHSTLNLDPPSLARLRRFAAARKLTLFPLVLTAYARQLARLTGSDDLVIGTALSGRDHPLPDIAHVVGCFATGIPLRLRHADGLARIDARDVAGVFVNALQHALPPARIAQVLPDGVRPEVAIGAQFFFTFVDLSTYGDLASESVAVRWDESGSLYDPPLAGVDLVVAAQPSARGLQLTFQAAAAAFTSEMVATFAAGMAAELRRMTEDDLDAPPDTPRVVFREQPLELVETVRPDAALIGYLPPLADIAALVDGAFDLEDVREFIRGEIFPDGRPRWVDAVDTALGRSAFVSIPWFADELHPSASERLTDAVAEAVMLAGSLGARSASLAGMIPSLTGYGFAVARRLTGRAAPELTTGHATTVASVVKSVAGALEATGQTFAESTIAFVGLGSIGQATLELLIDRFPHPRRLILCDVAGSAPRLAELSTLLWARGFPGAIDIVDATPLAPDAVYEASMIVGATSAPSVVDIDRLRPGTILVDDSFPPCFDPARAIARMQTSGDALIIGGGALSIGPTRRTVYVPPAGAAFRDRIADRLPRGEIASCQLESLLRAADPSLPVTRGLVTLDGARAYYDAVERAGYSAGAWQLGDVLIDRSIAHGIRGFQAGRGSPDQPM